MTENRELGGSAGCGWIGSGTVVRYRPADRRSGTGPPRGDPSLVLCYGGVVRGPVVPVRRGGALLRIVTVGSGVIALLTAVECVSAGHEVVVVDQADIPHHGATSFDRHRVLRALHLGDPARTVAALRAHRRWDDLQHLLSTTFYEPAGALTVLPRHQVAEAAAILLRAGGDVQVCTPADLASRYPHLRFPEGRSAVLESAAGVLLADRVLAACAGWLRWQSRAELRPHRQVVDVDVAGRAVRFADGEVLAADAVLLATGPWSRTLLTPLAPELAGGLVLNRQTMLYCEAPAADAEAWATMPPILSLGADGGSWLVPPVADTPLKLSAASACRVVADLGDSATEPRWRDHLVGVFGPIVPGFRADWVVDARDCHYLERATIGGPLLAGLGDRVLAYAACGGSSFKFAPLIARYLTGRLTDTGPAPSAPDWLRDSVVHIPASTATNHRPAAL